ncbi:nuclear transport factor 2 family protein [Kordiimonas lacus]|uniref:Predicted SnoaL-like aldol condensation-catalyzing enzyme n=1 Tax=Kordiimonas lacus TaxID=637679 RepID=A0A1G7C5B4_9PROT|nr:nuclear transport factor 2 family protein [Kordiimonas lacus]SDE33625.1 Predicted SnoaL-like aldol condensation-catalyzing enzyme [Kordiimonas lacus]
MTAKTLRCLAGSALAFFTTAPGFAGDAEQHALETANLEKAIYCMDLLENKLDVDTAAKECFGDTYIQHHSRLEDGRDAVIALFRARAKRYPQYSARIVRSAASGDLVWLHMHVKRSPEELGGAVVNIFRMKDGKMVEHWGVAMPVPETSKNDNGMF